MKKIQTFFKRKIAGECILIPTGDTARSFNGMFTLSETAEFLWDHLEEVSSPDELVSLLEEEYEVDHETANQDTLELLETLLKGGFVTLSDPSKGW